MLRGYLIMSRGCCGDEQVMWGHDQLILRGKRRGFGGMSSRCCGE
jgi:hypothetical protein